MLEAEDLTVRQVEIATLALQHRSASAVAAAAGISSQAVLKTIRAVEVSLGCELFARTSGGLVPTEKGVWILRRLQCAFEQLRMAREEAGITIEGQISIGGAPVARSFLIPRAIVRFRSVYPHVQVKVTEQDFDMHLEQLAGGTLDLLIGGMRTGESVSRLNVEKLFDDEVILVVHGSHELAARQEIGWEQLVGYQFLIPPTSGSPASKLFFSSLQLAGVTLQREPMRMSSEVLRGVLHEGNAIAVVSRHRCYKELEERSLVELPVALAANHRPVAIYWRRAAIAPAVRVLLDEFRAIAKEFNQRS